MHHRRTGGRCGPEAARWEGEVWFSGGAFGGEEVRFGGGTLGGERYGPVVAR